ncbi:MULTISPECIES: DUF2975 domain-containing protein [Grimontia]|uniref:DUF2975 domain-containing protein n=1 Tax=Grimontia marina TaxID=646534 RepID=A0A128FAT8_9GAMM|nr:MULTISPECIES: DUF2975 domain-containing protein [Grimontia]WRV99068.1 DUF2975 domain-containing protein [Grimontia sp. NTOU-MAR1]CZF83917.1 hypothetical protein GMA8713_02871 [Grimontia marina]
MQKIQTYSRNIRRAIQLLMCLLPLGAIYYWMTAQTDLDFISRFGIVTDMHDISAYTSAPLTLETRIFAAIASALPIGVLLYGMALLVKLFRRYESADIFSVDTANCYRMLGFTFFYWVLANLAFGGLISVILSFNNPPGERVLSLSLGSVDIVTVLCGFMILTVGWVMREAQIIAEEHQHTI